VLAPFAANFHSFRRIRLKEALALRFVAGLFEFGAQPSIMKFAELATLPLPR